MMNPVPWLQMTNMISYQGLVRTFPNIIEYAKQVTGEHHVVSVIGGFHLQNADEDRLTQTGDYLKALSPGSVYPCHCTDLAAKVSLARFIKINEVGVGLTLNFSAAGK
ncbi:MBL fold metallo-hydrolase [Klebsiella quasipneumoniae]|uniref:hypothetical protein n=1 Tax=Klebsiella quasipneumoniae TaxID=1463165 RepID=UPI001D115897|nr:hypothetical protein [Klebsiella quasipneumoniae]